MTGGTVFDRHVQAVEPPSRYIIAPPFTTTSWFMPTCEGRAVQRLLGQQRVVVLACQLIQQDMLRRIAGFQLLSIWQQGLLTSVVVRDISPLFVTFNYTVEVSPSGVSVWYFPLHLKPRKSIRLTLAYGSGLECISRALGYRIHPSSDQKCFRRSPPHMRQATSLCRSGPGTYPSFLHPSLYCKLG